jgi:galactofuranose transport system substrate-binding protein
MKHYLTTILVLLIYTFSPAAFGRIDGKTVVGFSQIGAESAWRIANTKSIKEAAEKAGMLLIYSDAQQKQENQIKAIRTFILQKVDVIIFSPVITSGWTAVLKEAKAAGIPVIVMDREVDKKDRDLYISFIGSDFREEGVRAGKCLIDQAALIGLKAPLKIVELRGTEGSAPATLRFAGFRQSIAGKSGVEIVRSENGDFKESLGKEWMQKIIRDRQAGKIDFNAVYAHNDNMALGAIAALEEAGMKPGKDIAIVSVDAIRDAFVAMTKGKLNCTVECSPLLGPQLMKAIEGLMAGKAPPKIMISEEGVFPAQTAAKHLPDRIY